MILQPPAKSGGSSSTLILILIVVVAFYFLMIRPQQRRKQQAAQKQSNVQPGARVRTTAGMYATVVAVDGDDVVLEVAPGVEVRYMKRAIMDVVSPGDEPRGAVTDFDRHRADDAESDDDTDTDTDTDVNRRRVGDARERRRRRDRQHHHRQHHQGLAAPAQATNQAGDKWHPQAEAARARAARWLAWPR